MVVSFLLQNRICDDGRHKQQMLFWSWNDITNTSMAQSQSIISLKWNCILKSESKEGDKWKNQKYKTAYKQMNIFQLLAVDFLFSKSPYFFQVYNAYF